MASIHSATVRPSARPPRWWPRGPRRRCRAGCRSSGCVSGGNPRRRRAVECGGDQPEACRPEPATYPASVIVSETMATADRRGSSRWRPGRRPRRPCRARLPTTRARGASLPRSIERVEAVLGRRARRHRRVVGEHRRGRGCPSRCRRGQVVGVHREVGTMEPADADVHDARNQARTGRRSAPEPRDGDRSASVASDSASVVGSPRRPGSTGGVPLRAGRGTINHSYQHGK